MTAPDASEAYRQALLRLLSVTSSPRLGLDRMLGLLERLGSPQTQLKVLHVAGTNGKGSVCAMLEAILLEAGHRVGLTTSPHLCSARERIRVQGRPISEQTFIDLEARVAEAAEAMAEDPPTFFERMIAMALLAFVDANIKLAVVEVGLGGRLDATNVVMPIGCVITPVGMDHQAFLGDDLATIAGEKAGILKQRVPAVIAAMPEEALERVRAMAVAAGAPQHVVGEHLLFGETEEGLFVRRRGELIEQGLTVGLAGFHQVQNAVLAVGLLHGLGLADGGAMRRGLAGVTWPGRFEVFERDGVTFVLDGAHNPPAATALAGALATDVRTRGREVMAVVGATRGHDPQTFGAALGAPRRTWATRARAPRSVDAADVQRGLKAAGWPRVKTADVATALASASAAAGPAGVVLVTGSLYLVGEVRAGFVPMAVDPALPDF